MIRCFLLEPTERTKVGLRRYTKVQYVDDPDREGRVIETNREARRCPNMPGDYSYHTALVWIGTAPSGWNAEERHWEHDESVPDVADVILDPRWPAQCACGYEFCNCVDPQCVIDAYQVFTEQIWQRTDTGEEMTIRDAPAGALWYADWLPVDRWKGPDGKTLVCKTPGGEWIIDGVASNCTMPDDADHRCWMRHGTPPDISVDKNPEPPFTHTCAAGAGSIQAGSWHGFLTGGELVG